MKPEKWEQVKRIFDAALPLAPDQRALYLNQNCDDDELRLEVEALLASFDAAGGFMQNPAVSEVADVIISNNHRFAKNQKIGPYEIIEQIGAGGMGEVYLARDEKLNRRVALKVLPETLSAETEARQRLLREAQAAAALDHPNICAIYEIAEVDNQSFIVMQYVEGETLGEKLGKEKLSFETSLDLAIQIAEAVEEAHAHHIIHRDIKPANIIINHKGQAKVLDFGLAKIDRVESGNKIEPVLSHPGTIMGTVPYMSPEQVSGKALDARTDIFSFGTLLFEMLSGHQPFARENNAETIAALLSEEPRWTEIPSAIQSILKKALQKNKNDRYQKTEDLVRDLIRLRKQGEFPFLTDGRMNAETVNLPTASDQGISPNTGQMKERRGFGRMIWAGSILILILSGLVFGMYYLFSPKNQPADFRVMNLTRLTANGKTKVAAISPDGRFVAYILEDYAQQSIWLKTIAAGSEVPILPPAENVELSHLAFSPNGNFIYYVANETLYQLPILGGLPKMIIQKFGWGPISFSPDGKQLAFIRTSPENEKALILAESDGSSERTLVSSQAPHSFSHSAVWSPDGKVIAAITTNSRNKVAIIRVADGEISHIPTPPWIIVSQIAWQPDGNGLLVTATEGRSSISHQIWSLSYPDGRARNVSKDLNNYRSISLTAAGGEMIAVRLDQVAHIWAVTGQETRQAKQLTRGIDGYDGIFGMDWLPGGKIIYETVPRNGNGEVWMIDADGRNSKQIVDEAGSTGCSPDGKFLVFQSNDGDGQNVGLFRLNLSSGEKNRLTTGVDVWVTFSPDGKWVVFTRWGAGAALWKISIEGGEPVKLTNVPGVPVAPAISPDGKLIAFYLGETRNRKAPEIAILPFEGGEVIKTFTLPVQYWAGYGKNALQWTPDGKAISYALLRNGVSNIWQQPIDGAPPVQVTNFESEQIFNFSYSRDGKQLALSRGTFARDIILIKNQE